MTYDLRHMNGKVTFYLLFVICYLSFVVPAEAATFRLKVGQVQSVDVDGDGKADLTLDLRGVSAAGQTSILGVQAASAPQPDLPAGQAGAGQPVAKEPEPTVNLPAPVQAAVETVAPVAEAVIQAAETFVVAPVVDTAKAVVETTTKVVTVTAKKVAELQKNPEVQKAVKEQVVPVTTVAAAAPLISLLAISNMTLLELPILLLFFILRLLEHVGLRRKRVKSGITYDAVTKQILPLALVRLYSQAQQKYVASGYADLQGIYGLPEVKIDPKDSFYLQAVKTGYHFPSDLVATPTDPPFDNIYHGERIKNLSLRDIPLDPPTKAASWRFHLRRAWQVTARALHYVHVPLLILGLGASGFAWLMRPASAGYTLLFMFYLVLTFISLAASKIKVVQVKLKPV